MDGQLPGEFAIRTYLSDTFLTAINNPNTGSEFGFNARFNLIMVGLTKESP